MSAGVLRSAPSQPRPRRLERARDRIEALLSESRTFPPPEDFRAGALIKDDSVYREAEADFDKGYDLCKMVSARGVQVVVIR